MSVTRLRFVIPLLAVGLAVSGRGTLAEEGCASSQCHAKLLAFKNVHPAAEGCDACHESIAKPHPTSGQKTFKLTQATPDLCFTCHDAFGKKASVHSPVKDGECVTCHDPHAADEAHLLTQPPQELCAGCHTEVTGFANLHGPVSAGDCTACHAPHEADAPSVLVKKGDELCLGCHLELEGLLAKPSVHPALESGCTSCHAPHGSAHPKLLAEKGAEACYQCHSDVGEKIATAPVVHAVVKGDKECAACHSPHAADHPKLLLRAEQDTCLGCHKTIVTKSMTTLHGPINDGKCTPCHEPHAGQHANLLVQGFPEDPYVPYSDKEYGLCFSCHKRDLLQYPDTSFATGFRDGDRNLHYLHVNNKQKGRSCRLCHNIHGGTSATLVAESVPFGKWNLPLKFVKTDTGGGCTPGCHKMQPYDREVPGRKPEPRKAPAKGK